MGPEGNLNLSLLLRPAEEPPSARWSLLAGLAVHDAILHSWRAESPRETQSAGAATIRACALALKWPNDLLLENAKLAGILIDSATDQQGHLDWLVIGIGVNIAHAPALPDRRATSLAAHGIHTTPDILAQAITAALDRWSGESLPRIVDEWLARAHPPGTRLRVQQGKRVIQGAFEGLNPDGSLRLSGISAIVTGDVSLEDLDA